jgi:anti-sigma B factor antagonist
VVEPELNVTVDREARSGESGPMVKVAGEVDIQSAPLLDEHLQRVLDEGVSSLVVDLGGVSFLDSTGLSALIACLKRCEAGGGTVRLVSARPNVRRVFEVTGLTAVFHMEEPGHDPTPD